MVTPIEIVLCILSVVVSYTIILGGKELVPGILRGACILLAVLTAAPILLMWAWRPYLSFTASVRDATDLVPTPAVIIVAFGHFTLGVTLVRRWLARRARPSPEAMERERLRGRERVRLPPRGEG